MRFLPSVEMTGYIGVEDGVCCFNPSLGGQRKTVESGRLSKPVEFDGFKIGIVQLFPDSQEVLMQCHQRKSRAIFLIVADNGGDWFLSGAPSPKWDDEDLATLKRVKGHDFEVVKMGVVVTR